MPGACQCHCIDGMRISPALRPGPPAPAERPPPHPAPRVPPPAAPAAPACSGFDAGTAGGMRTGSCCAPALGVAPRLHPLRNARLLIGGGLPSQACSCSPTHRVALGHVVRQDVDRQAQHLDLRGQEGMATARACKVARLPCTRSLSPGAPAIPAGTCYQQTTI